MFKKKILISNLKEKLDFIGQKMTLFDTCLFLRMNLFVMTRDDWLDEVMEGKLSMKGDWWRNGEKWRRWEQLPILPIY